MAAEFDRKKYFVSLVIFVAAAFLTGFVAGVNYGGGGQGASDTRQDADLQQGDGQDTAPTKHAEAPDFTLETLDGEETLCVGDFAGSDFVLFITITTCPICRMQIDELKKIYKDYAGKGVKFANAVIAETDEFGGRMILEDDILQYIEETKIPSQVYMDNEDTIAGDYKLETVPVMAFISKEGHLMYQRPFTYANDLSKILDALIAGKKIDTSGMKTVVG